MDLELTRSTVSEPLRIFLESHGYETEVCNTLRTKTFHSLPPDTKAAILGFLVDELNGSNAVTRLDLECWAFFFLKKENTFVLVTFLHQCLPLLLQRH